MKKLFVLLALLFVTVLVAEEQPGNLLLNSELDCGTAPMPEGWTFDYLIPGICYAEGGPGNSPHIVFSAPADAPVELGGIRQQMLNLVQGEKYRLSCYIRTKNFKARRSDFLIIDTGWFHAFGIHSFPANTDWKLFTTEFTLGAKQSDEKEVGTGTLKPPFLAVFYVSGYSGEIAFAQPKLEALTEAGRKGSSNESMRLKKYIGIMPCAPRLNAIPAGTTTLPINWNTKKNAVANVVIDNQPIPQMTIDKCFFNVDISKLATGKHSLSIDVFEDGKEVAKKVFDFAIAPPELPCPTERRLNTLTTELLAQELKATKTVKFTVPRRTWVYFKLDSAAKPLMTLSGDKNPLITKDSPRPEAQRRLNPGEYTVSFDAPVDGKLFIRTVPVLYKYAGINVTTMPGAGGYDLEFHKKHVFGVFNTMGARGVPEALRPYTASLGMECVDGCAPPSRDPFEQKYIDNFVARLNSPKGAFRHPTNQWVEFDEYFSNVLSGQLTGAFGLEKLENPLGKDLFHWFGGAVVPNQPGVHHHIMSSFLNAGGGHGYIAFEVYFKTYEAEKMAYNDISRTLTGAAKRMNRFIPGSNGAFGFIFGNFHQLPILSIDWLPEVNFKYFLDMEFHYLATHHEFTGIGHTGYWGFNYVNEEISRWCCELVRHYVLEGRTDTLSEKYGYTYLLPHLKNNDFEKGLDGWKTTGEVKTAEYKTFGSQNELRWNCSRYGNHFAVLTGNPQARPTVSQTVVDLIPGKPYYLEFITADYDDTVANKINPRHFDIEPTLNGAKVIHKFTYVDKRPQGRYGRVTAKTNYRYFRFVPSSDTVELTFTGSGKAGERLIMNYVRVAPYFEEK